MICSNEPGYYEDGSFGIRVENLLVIKEADTDFRWGWDACCCWKNVRKANHTSLWPVVERIGLVLVTASCGWSVWSCGVDKWLWLG